MKKKLLKYLCFLVIAIIALFWAINFISKTRKKETPAQDPQITDTTLADIIVFQDWTPNNKREILATIESEKEVKVLAQTGGEIQRININIGDTVYQNQILAQYKKSDDPLQIQFQNAAQSLRSTNLSAQNTVEQSKINLKNAQNQRTQVQISEAQKHQQAFEGLLTKTTNTKNAFLTSLNFIDRYLGASSRFYTDDVFERNFIGNKNQIKTNATKNKIKDLRFGFNRLPKTTHNLGEKDRITNAQTILAFGKELQRAFFDFDDLVRDSITSDHFTVNHQQSIQAQSQQTLAGLNGEITSLETQLEAAKGTKEGIQLALLNTENQVKNATANLALTKANAENQINNAQNQYRLAQNAQIDLDLKAPIAGKITEKNINTHDRVSPGQHLFTIINTDQAKKIVAFLTLEEWEIIQNLDEITVEIGKEQFSVEQNTQFGSRLDPQTQKIRVEIPVLNEKVLIGSFAKLFLPVGNKASNLLPLSAVSFEPDGAEVLIVNNEGITERRKIGNGNIIADSVEILDGLEGNEKIIEYYNRVDIGVAVKERASTQ